MIRVKGDIIMLAVKRQEVTRGINVLNTKAIIRQNQVTGEMVAGFLNPETGDFETAMEIMDERDIDTFLETYDLSVVMISKM